MLKVSCYVVDEMFWIEGDLKICLLQFFSKQDLLNVFFSIKLKFQI